MRKGYKRTDKAKAPGKTGTYPRRPSSPGVGIDSDLVKAWDLLGHLPNPHFKKH